MLLKRQIAKAHCSVGELFLTDLWYVQSGIVPYAFICLTRYIV